jgi:hypothetical protein
MYIVGTIVCLCLCFSVPTYVYYYTVFYESPELMITTDVSFVVVGYLCPFLNFMLVKNIPDFLHETNIPGKIYIDLFVTILIVPYRMLF